MLLKDFQELNSSANSIYIYLSDQQPHVGSVVPLDLAKGSLRCNEIEAEIILYIRMCKSIFSNMFLPNNMHIRQSSLRFQIMTMLSQLP